MRLILLLLALLLIPPSHAASLNGCDTAVRLGKHVLRKGDSMGRALRLVERSRHQLHWLRGPSGSRWTLRRSGLNARTYQLKFHDGQLIQLCQYQD